MKNILFVIISFAVFSLIWMDKYHVNTLEERLDNIVIENKRLLELDSLNQIKLDSLEGMYYDLVDTVQYKSIDTTVINWPWGREEFYYFEYKEDKSI
jgi:hypothetical protein